MNESLPLSSWLVLAGPTAVGKSAIAEEVAQRFNTDIVVADSRQVYQGLEIGTGKPDRAARNRVKRHLIDFVPPEAVFSAGAYKKAAETIIGQMTESGKKVLIEGGTGLYLKALLYHLWEGPPADWRYRKGLMAREKEHPGTLYDDLVRIDPVLSRGLHQKELQKIIRGLEVWHLTGRKLSDFHKQDAASQSNRPMSHRLIGLRRERADLYRRIDLRVEQYVQAGLVEEVKRLLDAGISAEMPSMQGLGYRQMLPYIRGEQSLDEAVDILKRDTRRFAKRQMTWFRADPNIQWLDLGVDESPKETSVRIMRLNKVESML